jgi:hypothetical protein
MAIKVREFGLWRAIFKIGRGGVEGMVILIAWHPERLSMAEMWVCREGWLRQIRSQPSPIVV